ncbi:hypothetical protein LTR09_011615 [Extremus antarcticus]|uniref:Uncharacterized protein n=1 Tax=Extremus antarcticus TaxID=702011 RepID=A0AAJ0DC02_9PEZI|nr:hypothetical protein LTR09_011615 [Extremus antarcticus]
MASYGYSAPHYHQNVSSHPHNHHGRSRRGPRISSQNAHRHYKAQRSPKEVPETPTYNEYLQKLEAAKSFDFEDDEVFCPFHLLSEDDLQTIYSSSSSDRGSLSSGSPDNSPLQHQVQPTPSFLLSSAPNTYNGYQQHHQQQMKIHQPMAQRTRNAIPIVDPSTRSVASPPLSVSPGRQMQQQYVSRRW